MSQGIRARSIFNTTKKLNIMNVNNKKANYVKDIELPISFIENDETYIRVRMEVIKDALFINEVDLLRLLETFSLEYIEASIEENIVDGLTNYIGLQDDGLI